MRKNLLAVHVGIASLLALPAIAEDQTSGQQIEEMIVKGQKIERSLQDTKESVAIVNNEQIEEYKLLSLTDVFNRTANAYDTGTGETFGIRGVTQNSASTGGGVGELGSLYLDGVAYTGFASRFGPKAMWDVEQVEILRGPQSTNVGRNALIGAVATTTKKPDLDGHDFGIRLGAGSYDQRSVEAMVNAVTSDTTAFRLTAESFESDGYLDNQTLNDDEFDGRNNKTARGQFRFQPSDQLNINLMAQYAETKRGQDIYRADLAAIDSRISSANLRAFENYEAFSSALTIDYQINDTLSLIAITSYIDGEYERFDDDDEGPDGGPAFRSRQVEDKNIAQEVRLNVDMNDLRGVVGVYVTRVELLNNTQGLSNLSTSVVGDILAADPMTAPLVPVLAFYPPILEITSDTRFNAETRNMAFFTEWDYDLSEDWTLSAGFRYDHENYEPQGTGERNLSAATLAALPSGDPASPNYVGPAFAPFVNILNANLPALLLAQQQPIQETTYRAFLPQLGVTRHLSEDVSLSAFYKRGYRSGGVEYNSRNEVAEYDPEYLDNYEISLRSVWLDGDLTVNANAYYGDWTDQQVGVCISAGLVCQTENAGESVIMGLELDTNYRVNDSTSLFASLGYAKTEFKKYDSNADGDLSGNRFAFSPEMTAAVGAQTWLTDDLRIGGTVSFQGESWSDRPNTIELDSRVLLDMNVAYTLENLEIAVFGKNLTDEFYLVNDGPGIGDPNARFVRAGAPRTVGVQLTYNF